MPRRDSASSWSGRTKRTSWTSSDRTDGRLRLEHLAQSLDQPPDPLFDGCLLKRAVCDPELAAVRHAEGGAGTHRNAVLSDQALVERDRIFFCLHLDEEIERAIRSGHSHER